MEQQIPEVVTQQNSNTNEDDIDFLALTKKLWDGKKIILLSALIGSLLGLIIAIATPNSYTSKSILVPQMNTDSKSSGLSGLAALAGINVGISQTSSEISPVIYPLIIKSIPFQLEMMKTPLHYKNSLTNVTYLEHINKGESGLNPLQFLKKITIGLPGMLKKIFIGNSVFSEEKSEIFRLTAEERSAQKGLETALIIVLNPKDGYATLTAEMDEPIPAAQMAQHAVELLQKYIIDFKIQKSKADLDFIQERFNEKKTEFEKAQEGLAMRIDRNKNFTSGLSSVETDRMQTRYTLTFGVYQELAKQLEQAKIQVKKETPVFSVIDPVTIPIERSKPNRTMILLIGFFIGATVGIGLVYGNDTFQNIWKKFEPDELPK